MNIRHGILASASAIALIASGSAAFAQTAESTFYGRVDTGWSWLNDADGAEYDDNWIAGVGIGYRFAPGFRTDLTVGYRSSDANISATDGVDTIAAGADLTSWAALVNVYYDIKTNSRFTPYVGGGIGFARNKLDDANVTLNGASVGTWGGESRTDFAWQLSAGVAISVSPGVSVDLGYRYIDLGKAEMSSTATIGGLSVPIDDNKGDLSAHEFQVGLRFDF